MRLTITPEGYRLIGATQDAMRVRLDDVLQRTTDPRTVERAFDELADAMASVRASARRRHRGPAVHAPSPDAPAPDAPAEPEAAPTA